MITAYPYGCLHSKGNNCTGKSRGLFAYEHADSAITFETFAL